MRMEDRGDLLVGTLDDDTLECTYFIVSDTSTDELREEVAGISNTEGIDPMHTKLYRHLIDRVDDEDRCSRSPGDIDDLRGTEEVDLELMLALKALTQTHQRGEEGMVVRLQLEGACLGQDLGDLTFVDEERTLTRSDDELTAILDFIK